MVRWAKDTELVKQIVGADVDMAVVPLPSYYHYLAIYDDTTFIGVIAYEEVTKVCFNVHGGLLSTFQKGTYAVDMITALIEYFKNHSFATCLIWSSPVQCIWVHRLLQKLDIPMTGIIPQGIVYNNKLQDLLIFSKRIER